MTSPMTNMTDDARDFLNDYAKQNARNSIDNNEFIVKAFGEDYERAYQQLNTYYAEAYRDLSFSLGNQWSLEEISYLNNQRRNSFTYNMCRRLVKLIDGIQRDNTLAIKCGPVENGSEETAEIMSDVMQHVLTRGGYDIISQAFHDSLITGIAWVCPYIDYRDDPVNGDIRFNLTNWNDSIWDPFFYHKDMSDCSFWARRKYLDRSTVISLLPEQEDRIMNLPYGNRDDKFTYQPFARNWGMQKLLNYTEYWRRKWEVKDVLVDMQTGETQVWKGPRDRLKFIQAMFPNLKIIKQPVKTVELGIIVEGELMYYGVDPWGLNDYPCVPIFGGDYAPSYDLYTWKLQGIVRYIRDPQVELNKRISRHVDLLDSQLNSGWIAKANAVTNVQDLFKSGNGQVIFVKQDSDMTDLQRIQAPDIPQGQLMLTEMFNDIIPNILGVNPEMLGMPENEKVETAAILAKMRQAAGLISLRGVIDNLTESKKIIGKKIMQLVQANYSPEKVQLITKKQPTSEFYSKQFNKYEVIVEEGLLTNTQKQTEFIQLTTLKQMGMPIPDSLIIEKSNLHCRTELNEILDAQAKQAEDIQNQAQQLELEKMKVVTDGIESKALSDQALAMERMNKIHLDEALSAERIQKAESDKSASELNFVKALKELQGMDLNMMAQKIMMIKELGAIQHAEAAQDRAQIEQEMAMQDRQMQI